jgi:hypothetical protein
MARPDKQEPHERRKKSKPDTRVRDWIIRGVVFGILGLLLILALLDFQAKQAATSTAEAWKAAIRAQGEHEDLTKSAFEKVPVRGRPTVVSGDAGPNSFAARTLNTFTWKGTFRTYTVKVYFGLGNDPPVEAVEGPGGTAE